MQTVFVVDDNLDVRSSLTDFLQVAGLKARGFESGSEFLSFYKPAMPGCLILDIHMPGMSGIELQENLCAGGFNLPIIIVSGKAVVSDAVKTMKLGTFEFIEKPYDPKFLLARVREALKTDEKRRRENSKLENIRGRFEKLTVRELEILGLVVKGLQSKAIASDIGLSISTVDNHRANLMKKLGAKTAADLTRIVLQIDPSLAFKP